MDFGKEATVELIKSALRQDGADAYTPICEILYKDVRKLLSMHFPGLSQADREDVTQDVLIKVIQSLPQFCFDIDRRTESERNGWLSKIVTNQCFDLFRKQKRSHTNELAEYEDSLGYPGSQNIEQALADKDALLQTLARIFSLRTSAESLIAFAYNRLLAPASSKNGSPRAISDAFYRKPMSEICRQLEKDLSDFLDYPIPLYVMQPLWDKIAQDPSKPFTLSERTIASRSSWVAKKAKEQHHEQ